MKIGLTYDLREDYIKEGYSLEETAELDKVETIEGIEQALQVLGYETERIGNAKQLIRALAKHKTWDLVFNIAEGLNGFGRESVVPSILETYGIPYTFSDPLVSSLCLHKGKTKIITKHYGISTADFFQINNESELKNLQNHPLNYPLFIKPVAEGTSKGIDQRCIIRSYDNLVSVATDLLKQFKQPLLVETFLSGREFTVCMVGTGNETEVLGIMEIIFGENAEKDIYSYINKADYENRISYRLLEDQDPLFNSVADVALKAWKTINCRDAGRVDVRLDSNDMPMMIEINPLAGLNPKDSDMPLLCGLKKIPYVNLIEKIVRSSLKRA